MLDTSKRCMSLFVMSQHVARVIQNKILARHNILLYYLQAGIVHVIKDCFVWHVSERKSKLEFCASTLSSPCLT